MELSQQTCSYVRLLFRNPRCSVVEVHVTLMCFQQPAGSQAGIGAQSAPPPAVPQRSSPVHDPPDSPPLPPPSSHTESEAESLGLAGEAQNNLQMRRLTVSELKFVPSCAASGVELLAPLPAQPSADGGLSSVSVSAPKVSIPPSAHHYCFSLDLRSLGSLGLPRPIAATLR